MTVDVTHWNPRRNRLPVLRKYRLGRRVGNFGDLIGPEVVQRLVAREGLRTGSGGPRRMLAVGSIMHLAHDGDTVWGTGVNGKIPADLHVFDRLDVRAVRGPLTRKWLADVKRIDAPEVYGDPALLLRDLRPEIFAGEPEITRRLTIIPNLNDLRAYEGNDSIVDPRESLESVVAAIRSSERVIASSLHAIIIAELTGTPVIPFASTAAGPLGPEPPFKYLDYYHGTGRDAPDFLPDLPSALKAGVPPVAPLELAPLAAGLRAAFPRDLWSAE